MDKHTWDLLLKNVDEMKADLKEVKKEVSTLKIRVATFGTIFGMIGAYIKHKFLG